MNRTAHILRTGLDALPLAIVLAVVLTACGGGGPTVTAPHTAGERPMHTDAPPQGPAPTTGPAEQAALNEHLRAAAWDNDVAQADRLIRQGADVNAKDETEQSAYLIATSEGYLDLLRLTLRHGARIDDKDSWNGTGLIRAAERGHAHVVGELLRAGIDRDHVNRIGYQAIHEAVWLGADNASYATTVRVLAAGGAELERRSPSADLTPLEMARTRSYTGLEKILDAVTAADLPADPDGALLRAAESGDADMVAVALRGGADIETRDEHERTALLLAVTHDQVAAAEVLVAMGADPASTDRDGVTALRHAQQRGHDEIARLLRIG